MNERILELALQAGYKDSPTVRLAFQGFNKEKFAELIVKECIKVIDDKPIFGSLPIKEHFGVEE